ncbi:hypothetical protein [Streptomyces lycii]|uniref:Uncharacterized protein n=1 Tax=Streptomyces lycii TaxID=2654337 RepID=A0ABQ7FJ48_9ACTN|nr:hypothetical protein [Streptomyces lycii]KAF4408662.1 hypothetical protein GCU69_13270 [Streptomyces lycii]
MDRIPLNKAGTAAGGVLFSLGLVLAFGPAVALMAGGILLTLFSLFVVNAGG